MRYLAKYCSVTDGGVTLELRPELEIRVVNVHAQLYALNLSWDPA